jgi:phosphate/sulfate permease
LDVSLFDPYLIFVVVLLMLAVLDLTVGVANDAVNFLNSALGSKVANFKVIMLIAALGVMAGVMFSGGMMEVARKSIFNPQLFYMPELMVIFLAVMFQDVLLLDTFNTFGLPTSTTVSIVFGLFGSALAMSIIKINIAGDNLNTLVEYINFPKVVQIVSAILLSIIIAFIVGSIVQYLTRMIFTFDYHKRFRKWGSTWGAVAITGLTFFIILKGAKNADFIPSEITMWIKGNMLLMVGYVFASWLVILQLLMWFTKVNILKIIVLLGTFALALAFAANDLVNFIGAPLAGLNAYTLASHTTDPTGTLMVDMTKKIVANPFILLTAGGIMVATLYFSRKARSVTRTALSLGKQQDDGVERFESNALARSIVRMVISVFSVVNKATPQAVKDFVNDRFDQSKYKPEPDENGELPAFDLLRAAVNLMIAAIIISFATSFSLPLSTTYVTFIVAMATALPDGAWGRESAVYRVSGVLTVIGGWFFTAFMSALAAFLIAIALYYFELYGIVFFALIIAGSMIRSAKINKLREEEFDEEAEDDTSDENTPQTSIKKLFKSIAKYLGTVQEIYANTSNGILQQDLDQLKKSRKKTKKVNSQVNKLVSEILRMTKYTEDDQLDEGHIYARSLTSLNDICDRLTFIANENYNYTDNNHHAFMEVQNLEYHEAFSNIKNLMERSIKMIKANDYQALPKFKKDATEINSLIDKSIKNQLKRIKKSTSNLRRSRLYLNNLSDSISIVNSLVSVCDTCNEIQGFVERDPKAFDATDDTKSKDNKKGSDSKKDAEPKKDKPKDSKKD